MCNRLQRLSTSQTPDGHGKLKDPGMGGRHFCNASILGIFVVLSVCCVTVDCQALVNQYLIAMYGANEVASGDPRGVGTVNLTLDFSSQNFVFNCRVITASVPSGASLYFGSLDSAGVLVADLLVTRIPVTTKNGSYRFSGHVPADQDTMLAIVSNPASYYFQVATVQYPHGAMRSQLEYNNSGYRTSYTDARWS